MGSAKERVEIELAELMERYRKLGEFLLSDSFKELGGAQQSLLAYQHSIMRKYATVLKKRLEIWDDKK